MAGLNTEQQKAVDLNADKILCLAGAGTGKTFCMISRISRIVSEGVDPSAILVLTFTRAAAFEMKERYQRTHVNERVPEFRTFHSFCYSLMASDINVRTKLGYFKIPVVADKGAMKRLETSAKLQSGIHLSDKQINGKCKLTPTQQDELEIYNKTVHRLLRQQNIITFDALCYRVCKLFVANDESILKYKQQYKYIFVDEFQDTDNRQYEFIKSFDNSKLFVVGDALQAIYSFRGADSSIIKRMAGDDEWTTVKLFHNYRSTKQICNYANNMSTYAEDSYRIAIDTDVQGQPVNIVNVEKCKQCNDVAVHPSIISRIVNSIKTTSGTSAILCRTNKEVSCVTDYLCSHNIPYFTGKKNTDNVHILKSVVDNEYLVDWLSTYLNADTYANFIRTVAISEDKNRLDLFLESFCVSPIIKSKLDKVFAIRRIFMKGGLRIQKCRDILSELGITDLAIDTDASTVSELVEYLIDVLDSDTSSNIYVGTIHSAKGLEYDNVYLVGVNGSYFKLTNEENRNLYYVGITRARSNLCIFYTDYLEDLGEDSPNKREFHTGPEDD